MTSNRELLEDWLQHPGTKLFFDHLDTEWGAGGKRFESTIDKIADSRDEDAHNLRLMQQVAVCRREILKLKAWPKEELQRLKHLDTPSEANPRQPMPLALAGQTRRGGL